jgi:uncharacterized membrane protein YkgB
MNSAIVIFIAIFIFFLGATSHEADLIRQIEKNGVMYPWFYQNYSCQNLITMKEDNLNP